MKKYILLLSLLLGSIISKAQTWVPVGNTLQRSVDGTGFKYRFSLGAPGFYNITDSIRGIINNLTFGNGLNKTGNNVILYGDANWSYPSSLIIGGIPNGRIYMENGTATIGVTTPSVYEYRGFNVESGKSPLVYDQSYSKGLFGESNYFRNYNPALDSNLYAQYGGVKRIVDSLHIYYNIKDYGAVGDSITDNTSAIKAAISAMPSTGGNLFIPSGIYKVTYGIELNKPIIVLGQGTIKQETDSTQVPGGAFPYSRFPVFKIMSNNVKIQDVTIKPKFEAVETLGFEGLTIDNVKIIGSRISKFAGIFLKDTKNVYVNNTSVTKIGTKAFDGDRAGHAIHINTAENIRINNCELVDNGSNGVFCFVSSDIWITNNNINYNGLSAIQFSFAGNPAYRQRNYHIINNNMEYNSADAVDVNDLNELANGPRKIDMFITGNKSIGNGFFQGVSTPDGSGVATLLNVASVVSTGNISKNNNAHGFYIYNSRNIISNGDQIVSPNLTGFYLEASDSVSIANATVNSVGSALRFTAANSNINIINNNFKSASSISLDYPNDATLTNYNISYNRFVGVSTINGLISLNNNYIECTSANTALGIYTDNLTFRGNTVKAQNIALTLTSRTGITLENNTFIGGISAAASLIVESNLTARGNKFQSIGTNPALLVTGASTLNLFFNDIGATGAGNNIRLDPGAPITVFQDKNYIHDGFPEYGTATINNVVYDRSVPSQVQNSLAASTVLAPSATAVNTGLNTIAKWQGESLSTASKAVGDVISYNGSNWINKPITATSPLGWDSTTSNFYLPSTTGSGSTVVLNGSPTLNSPIVGTQPANDNSGKAASTNYVDRALNATANEVILSKSANYTITLADLSNVNTTVVYVNATSGNITITLPSVANTTGRKIIVFKTDASANTVTLTGGVNINGSATYTVTPQYSSVEIHSNGTQYYAK